MTADNPMLHRPRRHDLRMPISAKSFADVSFVGCDITPAALSTLIRQLTLQRDLIAEDYCPRKATAADFGINT